MPNSIHRLDASFYKKRYPDARVVAPAAARAKVEAVIAVDALAEDELPRHGITVHPLPGWKHGEVGYELALPGGGRARWRRPTCSPTRTRCRASAAG